MPWERSAKTLCGASTPGSPTARRRGPSRPTRWSVSATPTSHLQERTGNITRADLVDLNGDGKIDRSRRCRGCRFRQLRQPVHQACWRPARSAPNLSAPLTDEVLLSVEHALLPEFVVGLNLTYRKLTNLTRADLMCSTAIHTPPPTSRALAVRRPPATTVRRVQAENPARPNVLPNGQHYDVVYYELKPGVNSRGGTYLHKHRPGAGVQGRVPDLQQAPGQPLDVAAATSPGPTGPGAASPDSSVVDPTHFLGGGYNEGDIVMQGSAPARAPRAASTSTASGRIASTACTRSPGPSVGFNAALNLTGRQGYPLPYYVRLGNNFRNGIRASPGCR